MSLSPTSNARAYVAMNVRLRLAQAGWSASKAARAIGMSQTAMSRRTTGDLPFDVDELGLLADALGIEIDDFFFSLTTPAVAAAAVPRAGGERFLGVTPIRRGWATVGPDGLEPPTDSV